MQLDDDEEEDVDMDEDPEYWLNSKLLKLNYYYSI